MFLTLQAAALRSASSPRGHSLGSRRRKNVCESASSCWRSETSSPSVSLCFSTGVEKKTLLSRWPLWLWTEVRRVICSLPYVPLCPFGAECDFLSPFDHMLPIPMIRVKMASTEPVLSSEKKCVLLSGWREINDFEFQELDWWSPAMIKQVDT